MDRAVLPQLEGSQVEPERRDLPAEVLHLTPGDALEAVLDERVLGFGQLLVELRRRAVAAGQRRLVAGEVTPECGGGARR